ncbi:MAG: hypothetical protein AAGA85_04970 [Bacteroidota bacterium]
MRNFVLICVAALCCVQCNLNELEVVEPELETYEGLIAFPLGELTYPFRDILEDVTDSTIELEESDSLFTMIFRDTIFFNATNELVGIPNNRNTAILNLPATPPVASTTIIPITESFTFTFPTDNGEQLDSLVHDEGQVALAISSTLASNFDYQLTIQSTRRVDNNTPLSLSGNVQGETSAQSAALANHVTGLERGTNFNLYEASISGNITLLAGQEITATDVINFELTYQDQTFLAVYGDFGVRVVEVGRKESELQFFDQFGSGVQFGEPQINLSVENSYGIPMGFQLGSIFGRSIDENGDTLTTNLEGTITDSNVAIGAPTEQQQGQTVTTDFQINNGNSELRDFFAIGPSTLGLAFDAELNNPAGSGRNFYENTSSLRSNVEIRLPFNVRLDDVEFVTSYPYPPLKEPAADSVVLRFVTENELPMNAVMAVQIYTGDTLLYTVPEELFLATPFLDRNLLVTGGEVNIANMELDEEGVEAFKNGDRVDLVMTFNTPKPSNSQEIFVDLFNFYKMEVKASVIVRVNLDIRL